MANAEGQPSKPHVRSHTSVKETARIQIANKPSRISRLLAFIFNSSWEKCIVPSSSRSFSPPRLQPVAKVVRARHQPRTLTRQAPQAAPHQTPQVPPRVQFPLRRRRRQVPPLLRRVEHLQVPRQRLVRRSRASPIPIGCPTR